MKKPVKVNYIYNLIYQIIIICLPIITIPYLSRRLGAEGVGVYSYTLSITTYFILFGTLGINLYGQREIAYNQDNKKEQTKIFYELFIIKSITTLVALIFFNFIMVKNNQYSLYYKILNLEFVANIFDTSWFYQGNEKFKSILVRNIIIKSFSIISIFIFIKKPEDIYLYFWIYCFSNFFGNLSLGISLKKNLYKIKIKEINVMRHFKSILIFFIPQVAIQIYTLLDKSMIGILTNNMVEVGFYEQSQKIIKLLLTIITSVSTVMLPRIANCFVNGDNKKIKSYMIKTFSFVYLLSFPMIFGIILISNQFVPLFFGPGYEKISLLLPIMSLIMLFIGFSGVIGNQYLLATKKQKQYTISVIFGACVNFLLNILMIRKFLSLGAVISTVLAEFWVMVVQFYFIRKDFDMKIILKNSKVYLLSGCVMFINSYFIGGLFSNDFISLIVKVIVGMITYVTCLILYDSELFASIVSMLGKKLSIISKLVDILRKRKKIIIILDCILIACLCIYILPNKFEDLKYNNINCINYSNSPVLGDKTTKSLFDPFVVKGSNDEYIMYVSYRNKRSIAITTSKDGVNWSDLKIVLEFNEDSGWEHDVNRATVVKKDDKYYMYYTGQKDNISKIGVAESDDGYKFKRIQEEPILEPEYEYEKNSVMNPMVLYDTQEEIFKMWYAAGETYEPDVISYATSKDGINWQKYEKNPVMKPSDNVLELDSFKVGAVDVHKINNDSYLMFYIGYTDIHTARILFAVSNDGINWKKYNTKELLGPSMNTFAQHAVYKPAVVIEDGEWMLWYNGRTGNEEYIGFATCK